MNGHGYVYYLSERKKMKRKKEGQPKRESVRRVVQQLQSNRP